MPCRRTASSCCPWQSAERLCAAQQRQAQRHRSKASHSEDHPERVTSRGCLSAELRGVFWLLLSFDSRCAHHQSRWAVDKQASVTHDAASDESQLAVAGWAQRRRRNKEDRRIAWILVLRGTNMACSCEALYFRILPTLFAEVSLAGRQTSWKHPERLHLQGRTAR